jgi:acyl-CoA thioester hydrolase
MPDSSSPAGDDFHETEIRVRYCETDAMGLLHHGNYINFFEIGRTELFRHQGGDYRGMEERGYFLVVVNLEVKYRQPARFDDVLTLRTRIARQTPAKLEHEYVVRRGNDLIAEAKTTLACVDREGKVQRLTQEILFGT